MANELTAERIALIIGSPLPLVKELLAEEEQRGTVVRDGAEGWRLSTAAEKQHGRALRDVDPPSQKTEAKET